MNNKDKRKKIILTGGGTAGSVVPLIGIIDEFKKQNKKFDYLWLGTKTGPEKTMVEAEGVRFMAIINGKWRRYFSWRNFLDIFLLELAFGQALWIIIKEKPDLVLSVGSYVSVPVAWAAWLARVPVMIHQQDVRIGLANKLMAPVATRISVTFEKSLRDYKGKAEWVGNSVREEIRQIKLSPREAKQKMGLNHYLPVVLITGGGTGAVAVNELLEKSLDELTKFCQIVHITGKGKQSKISREYVGINPNYQCFEFLDTFGMIKVFASADIVVSRCGMATLTELSYLGKPSILIPLPDSHQVDNALVFQDRQAAIVLEQDQLTPAGFINIIKKLLSNEEKRRALSGNIKNMIKPDGNKNIVSIIKEILKL